ncbi:hypothetical protein D3C87_2000950 [compost metagenome]
MTLTDHDQRLGVIVQAVPLDAIMLELARRDRQKLLTHPGEVIRFGRELLDLTAGFPVEEEGFPLLQRRHA